MEMSISSRNTSTVAVQSTAVLTYFNRDKQNLTFVLNLEKKTIQNRKKKNLNANALE